MIVGRICSSDGVSPRPSDDRVAEVNASDSRSIVARLPARCPPQTAPRRYSNHAGSSATSPASNGRLVMMRTRSGGSSKIRSSSQYAVSATRATPPVVTRAPIDQKTRNVVLYWFDSIGMGCEEFRGGWQGDTLTRSAST
jgi:hypothetical protein